MGGQQGDLLQATVLVDVATVLAAGAALQRLSRLARQPAVIGEILAGIILGPSLLGLLPGHLTTLLFPLEARPFLSSIAQIGLLLFMFTLGWDLEPKGLAGLSRSVTAVTLGGILLPFGLGLAAAPATYGNHAGGPGHHVAFSTFAVYLGVSMSITAFPVLARILSDNGLGATRVGLLVLPSAALGDVIAWCLLAVVVSLATASGPGGFMAVIGWSMAYMVAMGVVVRPLLRKTVGRLLTVGRAPYLAGMVAAGVFLSSYITARIGIHPIFGAFAFGIVMPREPLRGLETNMIRPFREAAAILLPVYFIVTGLSVDIGGLHGRDWVDFALLLSVACLGKIIGASGPALWTGLPWRDALGAGVLMNTRGLTELIILNVGLGLGVLDARLFTIMVLVALVTTAMSGPLLPLLGLKTRIAVAAPTDELAAEIERSRADRQGQTVVT